MPKKSDQPLTKHTLNLYAGDYARMMDTYTDAGASRVVRELVRQHLNRLDAKTEQAMQTIKLPNIDIGGLIEP